MGQEAEGRRLPFQTVWSGKASLTLPSSVMIDYHRVYYKMSYNHQTFLFSSLLEKYGLSLPRFSAGVLALEQHQGPPEGVLNTTSQASPGPVQNLHFRQVLGMLMRLTRGPRF